MALAISEQWAELLEPGIRSLFYLTFSELAAPSRIPILFNQMGSTKSSEYFLGIGGMSDWEEFEGTVEYDNPEQGYKTTLTHKEYVKGFSVERKLVDDDQYNIINARPRQLAMSAVRTREEHAASVFVNAFSSSYTGGDSIALCGAHPYSPSNASTQANNGTAALSYDNVVTARRTMREFKDDRGKLVSINPNLILIPPELEETANRICNTMRGANTQRPDTADYSASLVQEHNISYLVWDNLTNAKDWWMIDTQLAKIHLVWLDRVAIEFALDPTSGYDLVSRYRGYGRWSYGWSDFRWVFGNNVA